MRKTSIVTAAAITGAALALTCSPAQADGPGWTVTPLHVVQAPAPAGDSWGVTPLNQGMPSARRQAAPERSSGHRRAWHVSGACRPLSGDQGASGDRTWTVRPGDTLTLLERRHAGAVRA